MTGKEECPRATLDSVPWSVAPQTLQMQGGAGLGALTLCEPVAPPVPAGSAGRGPEPVA